MASEGESNDSRLSTGVEGLDLLLGGGLVPGGAYLFMGLPGTGKTTLGNQACFHQVEKGRRAVYVTLLAETHSRIVRNLAGFSFFRPNVVGHDLLYVGAYLVLKEKRLSGLLQLLRQVIQQEHPVLLVLDGLSSAQAFGETEATLKEFIAELQVLTDMSRCTAILLANMSADAATAAEHSMVDGLIELTLRRSDQRTFREIEVLKFRGADHFLGRHDLEICEKGVVVRPRTELLLARQSLPAEATTDQRVTTGVPNLDAMLGGGLRSGSATMLLGFSGSGKTMLSLHFLDEGARAAQPGLYFGFYESPKRLVEAADHVQLRFREGVRSGLIDIVWQPPLRYGLDALAERLLENVTRRNVRRVVIDGLDGIRQSAAHAERPIRFLTALVNELRARDVTLIISEETQKIFGPDIEVRIAGVSALVDNIILLEYLDVGSEIRRLLSIVKQRGSGYEAAIRELCIGDTGITLADSSKSARAILRKSIPPSGPPSSPGALSRRGGPGRSR